MAIEGDRFGVVLRERDTLITAQHRDGTDYYQSCLQHGWASLPVTERPEERLDFCPYCALAGQQDGHTRFTELHAKLLQQQVNEGGSYAGSSVSLGRGGVQQSGGDRVRA